jgi:hypothetical protein
MTSQSGGIKAKNAIKENFMRLGVLHINATKNERQTHISKAMHIQRQTTVS